MTTATLILLGLSAAASLTPARSTKSIAVVSVVTAALLGCAAMTGALAEPVHGVTLALTYVLTVAAAVTGGSATVTAVFRIAHRGNAPSPAGPLHGGKTIGALERTAVAASILSGWPEGIAIVLAVKGLARYPELRGADASASEQFIIGTFTSVMWAVAVCGVGQALVT